VPEPHTGLEGRTAELAKLVAAAQDKSATAIGIFGRAGCGKTSLALALARQLAPRYPDGQVVVKLRPANGAMAAAVALGQVIHAVDPLLRLPADEPSAFESYRRVLKGRRLLLLLDDAAPGTALSQLLPPAGCLMVVTSDKPLNVPGLAALDLAGLLPEAAKALLLSLAPRLGPHADKLSALCLQLPLALQLVGRALAARADVDPADFVQRLVAEQFRRVPSGEVDAVQAALALSLELLTPEAQRLLWLLSVFPSDFDQPAAGAVWSVTYDQASRALDALTRFGLVVHDQALQRYWLHEVVRRAVDQRLNRSEREQTRRRHAAYYAQVLLSADQLYAQGGAARARGLKLFDLEHWNILAGQAWAAEHLDTNSASTTLVHDYARGGAQLLELRRPLSEQLAWLDIGARAAHMIKDWKAECELLDRVGELLRQLRQPGRAIGVLEQALRLGREIGDQAIVARTLWSLALAHKETGDLTAAIEAMQACVEYERGMGEPGAEQRAAELAALRRQSAKRASG
jgi:hypothetical protein